MRNILFYPHYYLSIIGLNYEISIKILANKENDNISPYQWMKRNQNKYIHVPKHIKINSVETFSISTFD